MSVIASAARLADEVLFPAALATDRAPLIPVDRLDALADAGFYGLFGPETAGGLGCDPATGFRAMEALAGGCLTTTFLWAQHHGSVITVATRADDAVRDEWLAPLCTGTRRAGVAFAHLRRPDPPMLRAEPVDGGWVLDGAAPWVTGWGRIDVVHVAARHGRDVVWSFVDALVEPTLSIEPLPLAAVNASGTVAVRFARHHVPAGRVTVIEPFEEWAARDAAGLRANGSLALGLIDRCARLLGSGPFDGEADRLRDVLDRASAASLPGARAEASVVALRAAAALLASEGGRSVVLDHHAQRLAREALFLLVQGQTPAIRTAQVDLLAR